MHWESGEHYSLEELKGKLTEFKDHGSMDLCDVEFLCFCEAMRVLPKDIIDRVLKEVYFIVLSSCKKIKACYQHLESDCLNGKQAIIFVSPTFFTQDGDFGQCVQIAHEVAHHMLQHKSTGDADTRKEAEEQANELADKWMTE